MQSDFFSSAKGGNTVPESQPRAVRQVKIERQHHLLTQAILQTQTDDRNELVQENAWLLHPSEQQLRLRGNVFDVLHVPSATGRVFIKQAPLPSERPIASAYDLSVCRDGESGYEFTLYEADGEASDSWVEIEYAGGILGRARALQEWQQSCRPRTTNHRLPCLLANTWGDMSGAGRVSHAFIEAEIEAARRMGVEVLQIDDGWQTGVQPRGEPQMSRGLWNTHPRFWDPHPQRLPQGLEPLVRKARAADLNLGLWFVPDWANENANWERDADCVLRIFREHGIEHFKIDAVRARTARELENCRNFINRVLAESNGRVVFELDVTAGVRPGYFGALEAGPLFVENRYTDWHNYWPHQTLRNFWKLSRWVDPRRLHMEFLNNERHSEKYTTDPLAPGLYRPDTLFASVMFGSPLASMELSALSPEYIAGVVPLVQIWKEHRERLFAGTIIPIGDIPDGYTWTGFASVAASRQEGYVLLLRQANPVKNRRLILPGLTSATLQWKTLAGRGEICADDQGISVSIPEPFDFVFARFDL